MASWIQFLSIWLTKEQREFVKKALGVEWQQAKVPLTPKIVLKYGILPPSASRAPNTPPPGIVPMYGILPPPGVRLPLTKMQKLQMKSAVGHNCDFIEIKPNMTLKYGLPLR